MIVAVLSLKDTATLATPGTASRLALDDGGTGRAIHIVHGQGDRSIRGHRCGRGDDAGMVNAALARNPLIGLFMGMLRSRVEKEGCDEVEAERGSNEDRREDEACLDDAARQQARAGLAVGAGASRGPMHQPIAVTEEGERRGDEPGLIGSKPGEIPDPCPADPEAEQNKGQDAARRRREARREGRPSPLDFAAAGCR